jgi:hypothetical protein
MHLPRQKISGYMFSDTFHFVTFLKVKKFTNVGEGILGSSWIFWAQTRAIGLCQPLKSKKTLRGVPSPIQHTQAYCLLFGSKWLLPDRHWNVWRFVCSLMCRRRSRWRRRKGSSHTYQIAFGVQFVAVHKDVSGNMARVSKQCIVKQWQNDSRKSILSTVFIHPPHKQQTSKQSQMISTTTFLFLLQLKSSPWWTTTWYMHERR